GFLREEKSVHVGGNRVRCGRRGERSDSALTRRARVVRVARRRADSAARATRVRDELPDLLSRRREVVERFEGRRHIGKEGVVERLRAQRGGHPNYTEEPIH